MTNAIYTSNARKTTDKDHHPGAPSQTDVYSVILCFLLHGDYARFHIGRGSYFRGRALHVHCVGFGVHVAGNDKEQNRMGIKQALCLVIKVQMDMGSSSMATDQTLPQTPGGDAMRKAAGAWSAVARTWTRWFAAAPGTVG